MARVCEDKADVSINEDSSFDMFEVFLGFLGLIMKIQRKDDEGLKIAVRRFEGSNEKCLREKF